MFFFDPLYLIISLPGLLLGFWAQSKVRSAFNKYSKVPAGRGTAGAQVARRILDSNGLGHVNVEETRGFLSDHYDSVQKDPTPESEGLSEQQPGRNRRSRA